MKCAPSLSNECNSTNLFTPIHDSTTPSKAAQPQKKLEMRATIIEDVEDEDEKKMREKEKAQGPGILEDVDEADKKNGRKEMKPNEAMRTETDTKHEEKSGDTSDMNAAAKFLQQLKVMKDRTIDALKKWTSRQRESEVTISLFQALITAPIDDAIRTLKDLQHPFQHVLL